jgi:hypothetical protein
VRDGPAQYVDYIPRDGDQIQTNLLHPTLSGIATMVNADLPAPTTETMEHLKSQCATIPHL